jgi:hypothetical protein
MIQSQTWYFVSNKQKTHRTVMKIGHTFGHKESPKKLQITNITHPAFPLHDTIKSGISKNS